MDINQLCVAIKNNDYEQVKAILENWEQEKANYSVSDTLPPHLEDAINQPDPEGQPPLFLATRLNREEIATLLLDYGADVNRPRIITEAKPNSSTPLAIATQSGFTNLVTLLLKYKADANLGVVSGPLKGYTPLFLALASKDFTDLKVRESIVGILIANGANPNFHFQGMSPLYYAAQLGSAIIVESLLGKGADCNFVCTSKLNPGVTPLLIAIKNKKWEVVEFLLKNEKINANLSLSDGTTPLFLAVQANNVAVVESLLLTGADPNLELTSGANTGATSLHVAAQLGFISCLKLLLQYEAKPNTRMLNTKATPLFLAVDKEQLECASILLENGADPNLCDINGASPLVKAVGRNNFQLVALLLKHKADPNSHNNQAPPLYIAAQNGVETIVDLLLDQDANPEAMLTDGKNPIYIAAYNGHFKIVQRLIQKKVTLKQTHYGNPPLYIAAQNNHVEITKLFIESGANVDEACTANTMKIGETATYVAAELGNTETLAILLDAGANFTLAAEGTTPLHIAAENQHQETFNLLLEYGAGIGAKLSAAIAKKIATFNFENKVVIGLEIEGVPVTRETPGFELAITTIEQFKQMDEKFYQSQQRLFQTLRKNKFPLNISEENFEILFSILKPFSMPSLKTTLITRLINSPILSKLKTTKEYQALPNELKEEIKSFEGKKTLTQLFSAIKNNDDNEVKTILENQEFVNLHDLPSHALFRMAIEKGLTTIVELFLKKGANPNFVFPDGVTPLFIAINAKQLGIVNILLEWKANCEYVLPASSYFKFYTPLFMALNIKFEEAVAVLAKKTQLNAPLGNNLHYLLCAARQNNEKMVKTLLEEGINPNTPYTAANVSNVTVLHFAAQNGYTNIVELLLKFKADPNFPTSSELTPLHLAAINRKIEVLKLLIKNGGDVHRSYAGKTILFTLANSGYTEIATVLLDHQADPNFCLETGESCVFSAAAGNQLAMLKLLISRGGNPNLQLNAQATENPGASPLFIAVKNGFDEIVEALLANKADPDLTLIDGTNAIYVAAEKGYFHIVRHLIKWKAKLTQTVYGIPPLYIAAQNNRIETVKLLIQGGANVDEVSTTFGETALHIAVKTGNTDIVEILIEAGANFNLTTRDNKTPLFIAAEMEHQDTFELLLEYGAGIGGKIPASTIENNVKFNNKIVIGLTMGDAPVTCKTPGFELAITTIEQFKQMDGKFYQSQQQLFQTLRKNKFSFNISEENFNILFSILEPYSVPSLKTMIISRIVDNKSALFCLKNSEKIKQLPDTLIQEIKEFETKLSGSESETMETPKM